MTSISFLRRTVYQAIFILIVLGIWAFFVREQATEMTMPPPWEVGRVFFNFIISGGLLFKLYHTVLAIVVGLFASILISMIMTSAALLSTRSAYVVEVLTTIMHPMPSVAMNGVELVFWR